MILTTGLQERNVDSHVLMLSSSRVGNDDYLAHAKVFIDEHLAGINKILFVPFAAVSRSYDDYLSAVQIALPDYEISGLHHTDDPVCAVKHAKQNRQAILVGGGNTFQLLSLLYQFDLIAALRDAVTQGAAYIGWSAGANICGQSIRTTNDMPIVEPPSFAALNLVPFQINPHYTDYHPPGHNGETRDERLLEFTALHPSTPVVAIREGSALRYSKGKLRLIGNTSGFIFQGVEKVVIDNQSELDYLL